MLDHGRRATTASALIRAINKRGSARRRAIVERFRAEEDDSNFVEDKCTNSSCTFEDITDTFESSLITEIPSTNIVVDCTVLENRDDYHADDEDNLSSNTCTYRVEIPRQIWSFMISKINQTQRRERHLIRSNLKQEANAVVLDETYQLQRLIKMFESITVTPPRNGSDYVTFEYSS
jgi:hypothetical protein